jgi:hypothetical protein
VAALLQPLDDGAEVQPCAYMIMAQKKITIKAKIIAKIFGKR